MGKKKTKKRRAISQSRYNKSYNTKDTGGSLGSPFDWKRAETEVKFYKAKEGKNKINIIPYEIKSKNHPLVKSGDAEIGDLDYVMDLWIHRSVGPSDTDMICLKKNYGKPCHTCEEAAKYQDKGKKKEYDALKASRRVWYNVENVRKDTRELMVFGVSHFLFEKELIEEARAFSEADEILDFADIEEGNIVEFRGSMTSLNGNDYLKFKSFNFREREDELDEDVIHSAISFDDIMILRTYDEMSAILYGDEDEDESKEEEDDEEDEKPKKKSSDKKKKHSKKDEEEIETIDEDEEEEEEEEEEKPKKKKSSDKKKKSSDKCPHKHTFGEDCDEYDDCDECSKWDECSDAQDGDD